jgi:small subunit ribosomal protein S6
MSIRRLYESTFIINAALEDPDVEAVIRRVTDYIENHGGTFVENEQVGPRRRLAYPIKKKYNGYYVYMAFEAASEVLPFGGAFLHIGENVLRHLTLELSGRSSVSVAKSVRLSPVQPFLQRFLKKVLLQ